MRIAFSEKAITEAPASYVRVVITEEKLSRLVKESSQETLEIGVGKWSEMTRRKFILLSRDIVREAKKNRLTRIALQLNRSPFPQLATLPLPELARLIAENLVMANYEFSTFKSPSPENSVLLEEILICGETPADMQKGFVRGETVGNAVNACRELANTPGGDMTPAKLVQAAKKASKGLPIIVKTLDTKGMEKKGMGAVLAVGKGSSEKPVFIALEYKGSTEAPIVLIGKGVTFDSGGLNIKTEGHMYEMHMDMSGGAATILTLALAAKLKLKKHVVALIPAVENMSASNAVRPGDIIKSLSGKTIEVIDTDAEGRLILADALTYAKRYNPGIVIDVATLTGSSLSAVGTRASVLLTKDETLAQALLDQGEESGDYLWRLPLWEEYEENMKGTFADLVNLPESAEARKGDVINAAAFLFQFAKELGCPWAHLDIAPRMTANASDKLAKGAAGTPVRLLIRFIETWNS